MAHAFEADFELVVVVGKHSVAGLKQRTDDAQYTAADESEVFEKEDRNEDEKERGRKEKAKGKERKR